MVLPKKTNNKNVSIRGLASASPETRLRVSSLGGKAEHYSRGLQSSDAETRQRVASAGGQASAHKRNLLKKGSKKRR